MSLPYSSSVWETPALREAREDLAFYRARVLFMRHSMDIARECNDRPRLARLLHEITGAIGRENAAERSVLAMRIPYLEARIEELEALAGDQVDQKSYESGLDMMRDDLRQCRERHNEMRKAGESCS